jgi:ankyrin repeat protein
VVRELLGAKANPNVKNCPGNTPLVLSAHGNDVNIALLLFSAGADKELGGGSSPLQMAAFHGHVDMLRTLLSHRANPNAVHGDTAALLMAARNWHVEAVKILLEAGANPNFQTSYGGTALFDAVGAFRIAPLKPEEEERALKVVKLLVQYGADVNAKTAGQSPLQRARAIKEPMVVDFLTSVGAKP